MMTNKYICNEMKSFLVAYTKVWIKLQWAEKGRKKRTWRNQENWLFCFKFTVVFVFLFRVIVAFDSRVGGDILRKLILHKKGYDKL